MVRLVALSSFVCVVVIACNVRIKTKEPGPGLVYSDYRIWGYEESGNIGVKLQYFLDGPDGPAISLHLPASVSFDGEMLYPDSSQFNGTYYQLLKTVDSFAGKHEIILIDSTKKEYRTTFDFPVLWLKEEIPPVVTRTDLVLQVGGLKDGEPVRLVMVDTSFLGKGVEQMDTIKDGRIIIHKEDLAGLRNGPVNMSLTWEEEGDLKRTTAGGGRLYMSYGLKREFMIRDSAATAPPKPEP